MDYAETKRNLQFLKDLTQQKQNKQAEVKQLEQQIASLRKNPADKISNELLIYQYNKKIDILKQDISDLNKKINNVNNALQGVNVEELDEEDKEDFISQVEVINESTSVPTQEPVLQESTQEPLKETTLNEQNVKSSGNVFTSFIKAFNNLPKLILVAILSLISVWILFQVDEANLLSRFNYYSKFKFFSFMLLGAFSLLILTYFIYKNIDKKDFGTFTDFLILYFLILSVGILILVLINKSTLKLLLFAFLLIYSLIYFIIRLALYKKDLQNNVNSLPKFLKYYYTLFKKYHFLIIALIALIMIIGLYLLLSTNLINSWLKGTPKAFNAKLFIITDIILIALSLVYCICFAILRINESDLKIIDFGCFITQIFCLEFFALAIIRYSQVAKAFSFVFFAILFLISSAISFYRLITINKNEI